jgi:DNA-binding MarR family transcriptional regulator
VSQVETDRVDRLVSDVTRICPNIDPTTKATGARLLHLSDLVQRYYSAVCAQFGISLAAHSVLTALARKAPRKLTLTEINQDVLVTSAGVTFVVKQLEAQGLIERSPHPNDGRAFLLRLTRRGRQLADQVIESIAQADHAIISRLTVTDQSSAEQALRQLQTAVESVLAEGPRPRR